MNYFVQRSYPCEPTPKMKMMIAKVTRSSMTRLIASSAFASA